MGRISILLCSACLVVASAAPASDIDKLKKSTWNTQYKGDGISGSIHAYVYLNGDEGKYRALDDDDNVILRGKLSDIEIKKKGDNYIISGAWEAGGLTGTFKFKVDEDDLDSFSGSWETDDGDREGKWTGTRKPVPFIP